jgi:hypothetical protein
MKDKEIYDFFKDRKQAFDEAPGDALWARIESGLEDTPPAATQVSGRSLFRKLLILPLLAVIIALGWVIFKPDNVEGTTGPQNVTVTPEAAGNENTGVREAYTITDSVKKKKTTAPPSDAILNPVPKTPQADNSVVIAKNEIAAFDPDAVRTEAKTAPGRLNIIVKQPLTKEQFDLFIERTMVKNGNAYGTVITIKAQGHKPFRQVVPQQLQANDARLQVEDTLSMKAEIVYLGTQRSKKDTVKAQFISAPQYKVEPIKYKQFSEKDTIKNPEPIRFVNEVALTKHDSMNVSLKAIKAETKKTKGQVTITVKEHLTKAQFDDLTKKTISESDHPAGTIIIINAPGQKPFRYEVPK